MIIRNSTAIRIPIVLMNSSGTGVVGLLAANVAGGVARIYKADGVASALALSGSNFFAVDATNAPGLYHILLGTTNTDVLGPMQIILNPAAGLFEVSRAAVVVEEMGLLSIVKKTVANRMKIWLTGADANRMVIYEDDEVTVYKKYNLLDSAGNPGTTNPHERDPI